MAGGNWVPTETILIVALDTDGSYSWYMEDGKDLTEACAHVQNTWENVQTIVVALALTGKQDSPFVYTDLWTEEREGANGQEIVERIQQALAERTPRLFGRSGQKG